MNHQDRTHPWLLSMMQKHIHKHHEKVLQRELESCKGKPQMTRLGDAKHSNGYIISAPAARGRPFPRVRSSSRQRSHSSGGGSRPRTPRGKNFRSRSRSTGGTRKDLKRRGRSASPAFSATTGKYKFSPRGNTRLKQYKSKTELCHQWQRPKICSYGDACKCLHDTKAVVAQTRYEEPEPPTAEYTTDDIQEYGNTWDGDYDERDYEDPTDATALAFTKGKGKSKGKGKGRSKGKGKGKGKSKKGRSGKWFSQRPPCKFHALGNCTKGRDSPDFHSAFKHKATGAVAQAELDEANAAEAEAKATAKAANNMKKKKSEE